MTKLYRTFTHRIGDNPERKMFNNFPLSIAKKQRSRLPKSILWQLKTSNLRLAIVVLAIENAIFGYVGHPISSDNGLISQKL